MLTASASIAAALGMLLVYFLGNQTSWRNAALFCSSIPILAIFVILFVSANEEKFSQFECNNY